jgi:hypothetical protein
MIGDITGDISGSGAFRDYFSVHGIKFSLTSAVETTSGGSRSRGTPILSGIEILIEDQRSIPRINLAMATGMVLASVEIQLVDPASPGMSEMELVLTNTSIISVNYSPAERDGDAGLVAVTFYPEEISMTTMGGTANFINDSEGGGGGGCAPSDPLTFVHAVNALGGGVGLGTPITGYSFGISSPIVSTSGSRRRGTAVFDDVSVYAGLIPEAACLFGTMASGRVLSGVEIDSYDEIAVGELAAEINLGIVWMSSFHIESDRSGDITLSSSFQFETVQWIGYEYRDDGSPAGQTTEQWNLETGT